MLLWLIFRQSHPNFINVRTAYASEIWAQLTKNLLTKSGTERFRENIHLTADLPPVGLSLLFSIFEGETPLLVRAADTGRLLKAGEEYNTDANPVLLGELRRVLGQENVALLPPEAPKAPPEPALQ